MSPFSLLFKSWICDTIKTLPKKESDRLGKAAGRFIKTNQPERITGGRHMMPAIGESIFDIIYLIFAITSGIVLLARAKGRAAITLFGLMTLLLGAGDFFHLIPRVLNYWTDGDYRKISPQRKQR